MPKFVLRYRRERGLAGGFVYTKTLEAGEQGKAIAELKRQEEEKGHRITIVDVTLIQPES